MMTIALGTLIPMDLSTEDARLDAAEKLATLIMAVTTQPIRVTIDSALEGVALKVEIFSRI